MTDEERTEKQEVTQMADVRDPRIPLLSYEWIFGFEEGIAVQEKAFVAWLKDGAPRPESCEECLGDTLDNMVDAVEAGRIIVDHDPTSRRESCEDGSIDSRHAHAAKEWTIGKLRKHGAGIVLGRPEMSIAEAIQFVRDMTTEFVPVGECDDRDGRGVCKGHLDVLAAPQRE